MTHAKPRRAAPLSREALRDPLLSILTVLLIVQTFFITPLHAARVINAEGYGFIAVLLLASCALTQSRRWSVIMALVLGVGISALAALMRRNATSFLDLYLDASATIIIAGVLITVIAGAVFAPGPITLHRINGAILLYLTIGLTFAGMFMLVALAAPNSISRLDSADMRGLSSSAIYFSFTTLTSVGYGDVVPVHPVARSLANIEAIIGQLFPATLLARLVTLELSDRREHRARGETPKAATPPTESSGRG